MISPGELCAAINRVLPSLDYTFVEGATEHTVTLAGRPTIHFPVDAGGRIRGGSAPWVSATHQDGAIHEPGLVAALLCLGELGPSPRTVLDIGALYGYVALVARSILDEAQVHSFEANARSYRALKRNIEANRASFGDSVHAHHCALSDVSEPQVAMHIQRMKIEPIVAGENDGLRQRRIDVWTLDDFCRDHGLAPDLIKLDVEGYQAKIVPGALGVIAEHRPVVMMEFDGPGAANDFGIPNRDVIKPLMDDGYRLVWGAHRSPDARFEVLAWDELTDRHEVNSLGILVP